MKYGVTSAGSTVYLKSRVVDDTDTAILTAAVTSITYTVNGVVGSAVVVANVWYNTLQSWDEDSRGYNFAHSLAAFASPDTTYTVVYTITTTGGVLTLTFTVRTFPTAIGGGYCDRADIEDQFGIENVGKWADLENHGDDGLIDSRIDAAIQWATNEVDDRLRGGPYEVPIATPGRTVTAVAATLAGVWLYEARGVQDFDEASGKPTHKLAWAKDRAEKILTDVRAGKRRLDIAVSGMGVRVPIVGGR